MVAIKNLLLLVSTVTAAVISKREIHAYFSELDDLNTKCINIVPTINNYYGNIFDLIAIKNEQDAINAGVLQAADETTRTISPISDSETQILLGKVDTLEPNLYSAMNAIKNKKPVFDKNGWSAEVVTLINQLFASFHILQTASMGMIPPTYKDVAQRKSDLLNDIIADCLRFYGQGV